MTLITDVKAGAIVRQRSENGVGKVDDDGLTTSRPRRNHFELETGFIGVAIKQNSRRPLHGDHVGVTGVLIC